MAGVTPVDYQMFGLGRYSENLSGLSEEQLSGEN